MTIHELRDALKELLELVLGGDDFLKADWAYRRRFG
jgi:hypothetical protein